MKLLRQQLICKLLDNGATTNEDVSTTNGDSTDTNADDTSANGDSTTTNGDDTSANDETETAPALEAPVGSKKTFAILIVIPQQVT